jgi:hypothetical protein
MKVDVIGGNRKPPGWQWPQTRRRQGMWQGALKGEQMRFATEDFMFVARVGDWYPWSDGYVAGWG